MTKKKGKPNVKKRHVEQAEYILQSVVEDAPVGLTSLFLVTGMVEEQDGPEPDAVMMVAKMDDDIVSTVFADEEYVGHESFIQVLAAYLAQKDDSLVAHTLLAGYSPKEEGWLLGTDAVTSHEEEPSGSAEAWTITREYIEGADCEGELAGVPITPGHDLYDYEDDEENCCRAEAPSKTEVTRYLEVEEHINSVLADVCAKAPAGKNFITCYAVEESVAAFTKTATGVLEMSSEFMSDVVDNAVSEVYSGDTGVLLTLGTYGEYDGDDALQMRGWVVTSDSTFPITADSLANNTKVGTAADAWLENSAQKLAFCDAE